MKLMIASDLHGSAYYTEKLILAFRREGAERLLLLGDILYHGPRNDLPRDYAPKRVAEMLNALKDRILCVRGNCEAEVDGLMLEFPIMAEYCILYESGHMIFATHGHHFSESSPPPHVKGDILLTGHTHIAACCENDDLIYMNPGSVSIPKDERGHAYMTLENGVFTWKSLDGEKTFFVKNINC